MKFSFKLYILILLVALFTGVYSYSQNYLERDSTEFKRLQDSIIKYQNNLRPLVVYLKEILPVVEKANDTAMMIHVLHLIGRNSQHITEYRESTEYFERELQLLRTIDLTNEKYKNLTRNANSEIEVLAQLGQNYQALGQIKKAFDAFDQCIEIAEKENLEFYKVIMPTIIGNLHYEIGSYQEALTNHKKSFNGLKTTQTISDLTRGYNRGAVAIEISDVYLKLKKIDSAIWILDEGLREKLDTIDPSIKMSFLAQRGKILLEKKEYNEALFYLKEAEEIGYEYDSITAPANVSLELAECYLYLKDYEKAIETLENGIRIKKNKTKEIYLTEDYKLLAKIYKEAGKLEKSNAYYEKYIINQTALEKSKDTITSSFHEKEIQHLAKEKSSQKSRLLIIIGGISLVVVSLFLVILYLIKEKKKNEEKFNELLSKLNTDDQAVLEIVDTKDRVLEEKTSAEVNEETTEQILAGLQKLKEQEYFLKQECNSYNVAKKIKTNTSYLSKVINSHFQKNFNTYINDLRINYAILRLKNDSRFRSFSVQSIAEELGYKSADSFTKYFKLRTGLNPSFYIKELQNLS